MSEGNRSRLVAFTSSAVLWLALLADAARGDLTHFRTRVASSVAAAGGGVPPEVISARLFLLAGDFAAAGQALDRAEAASHTAADRDDILIARTFAAGMLGDFVSAMSGFAALADRGAPPWMLLAAVELSARVEATDIALHWAERLQNHPDTTTDLLLRLAEVLIGIGADDAAAAVVQRARRASDVDHSRAAHLLLAARACDEAEALFRRVLDGPHAASAHRGLATLRLWSGDTAAAVSHAAAAGNDVAMRRVRVVAALLEGHSAAALAELDELAAQPTADAETLTWRVEALVRAGRPGEALAAARTAGDRSPDAGSYAALALVQALATIRLGRRPSGDITVARALQALGGSPAYASWRALVRRVAASRFTAVHDALAATTRLARRIGLPAPHIEPPAHVATVLEQALAALGGNRSFATPTSQRGGSLQPLRLEPSPRTAAKTALHAVRIGGFADAAERLTALATQYPDWPQPLFYRAELHLWVGDLDAAERDLHAALAKKRDPEIEYGRWPRIGLIAVQVMRRQSRAALDALRRARWHAGSSSAEPFYAWQGEALRLAGRLEPARAALERVCGAESCRVGSLLTLALISRDLGDSARARTLLTRVAALAPPLLLEVTADPTHLRDCLDPAGGVERLRDDEVREVLERALTAMRGNRSAACLTFVDATGRLRAIPPNRFHRFVQPSDEVVALRQLLTPI